MQKRSTIYTIGFSAAVCIVCSLLVSTSAVGLKERQQQNALLAKQKNVLMAAGLIDAEQAVNKNQVTQLFAKIKAVVVNLETGEETNIDPSTFDQLRATRDPEQSIKAPSNKAQIHRLPKNALVYKVITEGKLQQIVLPVEGKGLWSTLYGFIALGADCNTINGITFYQHGETPGLGGEVDNPKWKALWPGRKAFDRNGDIAISLIRGRAGPVAEDPYHVDGLSGATLTSRGVTNLVQFWLGENGFGPYLNKIRQSGSN